MSSHYGLNKENLLSSLPAVLKKDKRMLALSSIAAEELSRRPKEIEKTLIYLNVDELPEDLLDILAYDFKIDWWDYEYTLDVKRQVFKDSFEIHRHMGTKWAVEKAISAVYEGTKVIEWFDYNGAPKHFKLLVDTKYQNIDPIKHQRVIDRIDYYKSLSAHLDGVEYTAEVDVVAKVNVGIQPYSAYSSAEIEVKIYGLE